MRLRANVLKEVASQEYYNIPGASRRLIQILWKLPRNFVDTLLLASDKLAADAEIEWKILLLYCYRREGGAVWNWDQREWKSNFSYRTEKWRHISCLFIFTLVYFTFVSVHVDMPHFFMLLTEIIYFVWVVLCINMTQVMSSYSLSSSWWCCLRTLTVTDTFNMQLSKQSRLPKDWICKVNWNESVVVVVSTCCCCLWQHLAVPLIASPPSITPRHVSRVTSPYSITHHSTCHVSR